MIRQRFSIDMLLIKDIMCPHPLTVHASAMVREAKQIMSEHAIRHLPVIEGGKLKGIITDRDLKLAQAVSDNKEFDSSKKVGDICVCNVYVVDPKEHAKKVLAYMGKERIGSALVMENGDLVGIFTAVDACKAFAGYLSQHDH